MTSDGANVGNVRHLHYVQKGYALAWL